MKFGVCSEIFEKVTSAEPKSILGGPAGGSALERASPPMAGETEKDKFYVHLIYGDPIDFFFTV